MKVAIWGSGSSGTGRYNNVRLIVEMGKIMYGEKGTIIRLQISEDRAAFIDVSQYIGFLKKKMEELLQGMLRGENANEGVAMFCRYLELLCSTLLSDGYQQVRQLYNKELVSIIQDFCIFAEHAFEYLYIDCGTDMNEYIKILLEEADIVLIHMSHQEKALDELFKKYHINKRSTYYLIDNDREAMISMEQLYRRYKKIVPQNTFVIPYNREIQNLGPGESVEPFLYQGIAAEHWEDNYLFIKAFMNISEEINCISKRMILGKTRKGHVVVDQRGKVSVS